MPRRVCVVTGSRAEYGLLTPLLQVLENDPAFDVRLVVTGAHLSERFGKTVIEIEADGRAIEALVPLQLDDDTQLGTIRAIAAALTGIAEAVHRIAPEVVVLLGDRFEILAAAQAAFIAGYPIAHIQGGELTEGALDDGFRHAITKLSQLHFVAAEPYRERVIRMGEAPGRVFNVSSLALDVIQNTPLLTRREVAKLLKLELGDLYLLLTYHPVTLDESSGSAELASLLGAIDEFPQFKVVITGHNADPGHTRIGELLERFAAERPNRVRLVRSLGRRLYLSTVKHCHAVLGNSSSGIIESPALGVPTVDVGTRQRGRLAAGSVVHAGTESTSIRTAIERVVTDEFRASARSVISPYGTPGAAERIAGILRRAPLDGSRKSFFDA